MTGIDRRPARAIALQVLYEVDCVQHPLWEVFARRVSDLELPESDIPFARQILEQTNAWQPYVDQALRPYLVEFSLDHLAIVDRCILRMAVAELAVESEYPIAVPINEAVVLAKRYGADSSPRLINGVLGNVVRDLPVVRREMQLARERDGL